MVESWEEGRKKLITGKLSRTWTSCRKCTK